MASVRKDEERDNCDGGDTAAHRQSLVDFSLPKVPSFCLRRCSSRESINVLKQQLLLMVRKREATSRLDTKQLMVDSCVLFGVDWMLDQVGCWSNWEYTQLDTRYVSCIRSLCKRYDVSSLLATSPLSAYDNLKLQKGLLLLTQSQTVLRGHQVEVEVLKGGESGGRSIPTLRWYVRRKSTVSNLLPANASQRLRLRCLTETMLTPDHLLLTPNKLLLTLDEMTTTKASAKKRAAMSKQSPYVKSFVKAGKTVPRQKLCSAKEVAHVARSVHGKQTPTKAARLDAKARARAWAKRELGQKKKGSQSQSRPQVSAAASRRSVSAKDEEDVVSDLTESEIINKKMVNALDQI
eukprot:scaffold38591_cov161-Skeletonema_dohrnii-CCMP3373.AAC.1